LPLNSTFGNQKLALPDDGPRHTQFRLSA